jgi:hypothetical protein
VFTPSKYPRMVKAASQADVVEATNGGVAPLTVKDFDLDDVEMVTKYPLMVPSLSFPFFNGVIYRSGVRCRGVSVCLRIRS